MSIDGHSIETAVLGFARIGPDRELKQALESFWRDETAATELEQVAAGLRRRQLAAAAAARGQPDRAQPQGDHRGQAAGVAAHGTGHTR